MWASGGMPRTSSALLERCETHSGTEDKERPHDHSQQARRLRRRSPAPQAEPHKLNRMWRACDERLARRRYRIMCRVYLHLHRTLLVSA